MYCTNSRWVFGAALSFIVFLLSLIKAILAAGEEQAAVKTLKNTTHAPGTFQSSLGPLILRGGDAEVEPEGCENDIYAVQTASL